MTNSNSTTLIYNYHDKATADIIIKWAKQYARDNATTIDYALIYVLLDIHKRSGQNAR